MIKFKGLAALFMVAALVPALGSCSKDDGNAPDGPNGSVVSNIDGTRVTSIGDFKIRYDEDGRAYRFIEDDDYEIRIDYSKNKIYEDDAEFDSMDVKFNSKGFITEFSASWDYREDGWVSKGNGKIVYSYDSDNCLTSVKITSSETYKDPEDNKTYKNSAEGTEKYIWKNGNLVKIDFSGYEIEDGEKENFNREINIEYSKEENRYRQFPISLVYENSDDFEVFYAVGLMGNGPVDLPKSVTVTDDDYDNTYSVNFSLNDNGSIRRESFNYNTYNYGYSEITRSELGASTKLRHLSPKSFRIHSKHVR